jgi:hypothetical protein
MLAMLAMRPRRTTITGMDLASLDGLAGRKHLKHASAVRGGRAGMLAQIRLDSHDVALGLRHSDCFILR